MTRKRAPGGGRKPLTPTEPTVKVAITLLASQVEAMQQLGNGNLSAGIRKAIDNMNTTDAQAQQITVQQLRQILFELANQDMTIRDLRAKLFDVENQHQPVALDRDTWKTLGIE